MIAVWSSGLALIQAEAILAELEILFHGPLVLQQQFVTLLGVAS
jgi:hypothetical protein